MAAVKLSLFVVVIAAAAAATLVASENNSQGLGVRFCGNDPSILVLLCKQYVTKEGPKEEPSKECCGEVAKYDVQCVCKNLPEKFQRMISMDKAVFVARRCGKNVPRGIKCGSYIVPMAA